VDPAPFGTIVIDKKTQLKRIFIQSFAQDNPYLMGNDPQYINRLASLPEAERRAKLEGDWSTFEGQVFSDYREEHFPDEPENAVHVVEPFEIPVWWPRFLAIDWGYTAMTYAVWGALSPEDQLFLYREYSIKEAKTSEWATEVGQLSQNDKLTDIVLCRSAWQSRGEELTQQEQFTKYSGLIARQAENDRVIGKLLVQEYLRFEDRSHALKPFNIETANSILIRRGTEAYQHYCNAYRERKKDKLPKLQIFKQLRILRQTIPLCIYDKKSQTTQKPAEDVKEFAGDDPYDGLRYIVCCVDGHLGRMSAQASAREQEDKAIRELEQTRDWTKYYRRMEFLERKGMPLEPAPVRRR
jgi:hypothetical protein